MSRAVFEMCTTVIVYMLLVWYGVLKVTDCISITEPLQAWVLLSPNVLRTGFNPDSKVRKHGSDVMKEVLY